MIFKTTVALDPDRPKTRSKAGGTVITPDSGRAPRAGASSAPSNLPPDERTVLRVLQSKAQTRAFYNKISRVYDLLSEHSETPVRQEGLELLKPRPGESILEIGCGTGHALVSLARAVGPKGRVYGLDLADQMVRMAKANLAKAGLLDRARLRCGDALKLILGDGSLDGVFLSFTLELFDTPEIPKVLAECWRVLRPGGRIVVVGMSKTGSQDPLRDFFEWTHRHFPNFLDCRPIYVCAALQQAGFAVARATTRIMWIPVEIVLGIKPRSHGAGKAEQ